MITAMSARDCDAISISSVTAYLKANGWRDAGLWGRRPITIYSIDRDNAAYEVLVPHEHSIADYADNMRRTILVLAEVEDRLPMDIFHDLQETTADAIHIYSTNGLRDKPLSLNQRANLFENARSLIGAAARSAENPRPHHRGSPTAKIANYLNEIQPIANGYKGYDLKVHSPVAAQLGQRDMGDEFSSPFERQATLTLARALSKSQEAIVIANRNQEEGADAFAQIVKDGVSANFCEALSDLTKQGDGIQISIRWADTRKPPKHIAYPKYIAPFTTHAINILREASTVIRRIPPIQNAAITAQIIKLERNPDEDFKGNAILAWPRDSQPCQIQVQFPEESREDAIKAFIRQSKISINGDLRSVSHRRYELINPMNLSIIDK